MRRYCSRCLSTIGALDPERCPGGACRSPRPARGWPEFLTEGTTIDERFIVHEILGAGGAGITYRCEDLAEPGDSALKILHDDRRHGVLANRLAIEGELLELLSHPNIVPFHALRLVGEGPVYLATRYMPGGSLEGTLRRGGPLLAPTVVAIGRQLALALDFIHSQGIVHRDLKPGNVLIERTDPGPVVRLADFGIARVFRERRLAGPMSLTRTGVFIGTPEYAAPEQIRGEKGIGPAADAFALGALLHYSACGGALLKRSEIADWTAFRERRRDPSERPRLVDVVPEGLAAGHGALLDELDGIIDALMHPDAEARTSLADAALALGASQSELAPRDLTPLAPRTLVSALDDGWFQDDGFDALVPSFGDEDDVEVANGSANEAPVEEVPAEAADTLPNLADLSGLDPTPDEPEVPEIDQSLSGAPTIQGLRRAVPPPATMAVPPPAPSEPDLLVDPDPNSHPDWEEDEIDWPSPRKRRRNRLHAALLGVAAMLVGAALGWPGGLPAFIGDEPLEALGATDLFDALAVDEPTYTPQTPWDGKRVLTSSAPAQPAPVASARPAPVRASSKPAAKVASKAAPGASRGKKQTSKKPARKTGTNKRARKASTPKATERSQPVVAPPVAVATPEPEPVREPTREPAAVDKWARNRADTRELPTVVRDEVGRSHVEWIERLVERYDERAKKYEKDAENDTIRREALFRAWDRQVEDAQDLVHGHDPSDHDHEECSTSEEDEIASAGR